MNYDRIIRDDKLYGVYVRPSYVEEVPVMTGTPHLMLLLHSPAEIINVAPRSVGGIPTRYPSWSSIDPARLWYRNEADFRSRIKEHGSALISKYSRLVTGKELRVEIVKARIRVSNE